MRVAAARWSTEPLSLRTWMRTAESSAMAELDSADLNEGCLPTSGPVTEFLFLLANVVDALGYAFATIC